MANKHIVIIALFLCYYHISGLATTNILRLTAGNSLPILSSQCRCDNCGKKIPPLLQLPIISFIICKGRCKNCKTKIPIYPLILEIVILSGMCTITSLFKFSLSGITLSFIFYELIRIIVILLRGKRTSQFLKQYFIAFLSMIPFYALLLFIALIYTVV